MSETTALITVVGTIMSVTVIGVTAIWKLANFFRDRPTRTETQAMVDQKLMDVERARVERASLTDRVSQIERDMARQGAIIENIDKNVDSLVKRLDHQNRAETQG